MMQVVMNSGKPNEEIMELVDAPEIVLVQYCDVAFRRYDIRIPEVHESLTEIANALKLKAEKENDGQRFFNRYELKEYTKNLEEALQKYPPYEEDEEAISESLVQ